MIDVGVYIDEMTRKGERVGYMASGKEMGKEKNEIKWRSQDEGSNVRALSK